MPHTIHETPLTENQLKEPFTGGFKKESELKIGVEWEKIGVTQESAEAIRYSGDRGVEAIFQALVKKFGWEPVFSGSRIIALKKNDSSITLEPGGQIELSGRKAARLKENASELYGHLSEIKKVSEPMGIVWLGLGVQPVSAVDQIEWVPKERYAIMRESLKNKGSLTYSMMKQTASIQISLDYTSEEDAVEKLRLAMGLSPILTALFANSPLSEGKPNGFLSRRAHIWRHTAPERTGIIEKVFHERFSLGDYLEYALSVPMLFIVRDSHWIPANGMDFREFMKKGLADHAATPADWDLHLTTLFTEARLKSYLEIRSIDCQKTELGLSAPALLKGIFYDEFSRKKAWGLVADLSWDERVKLLEEVPVKALGAKFKKGTLLDPARQLTKLAKEGLVRLSEKNLATKNEADYLKPLQTLLEKGKCPAEILLECLKDKFGTKDFIKSLIDCTAL